MCKDAYQQATNVTNRVPFPFRKGTRWNSGPACGTAGTNEALERGPAPGAGSGSGHGDPVNVETD